MIISRCVIGAECPGETTAFGSKKRLYMFACHIFPGCWIDRAQNYCKFDLKAGLLSRRWFFVDCFRHGSVIIIFINLSAVREVMYQVGRRL